jgi:hypothetical protein
MKYIKNTTWTDVFEEWKSREMNDPGWIECATKIKGWPDWESWRSFTASQLGAENREWKIFEFTDPMEEIPNMLVGPFPGWQFRIQNKNNTTFQELLNISGQYEEFSHHPRVLSIFAGLPFCTQFIAFLRKDTNKIVCFDGHHRATAIALLQKQGKSIDFTKTPITLALSEIEVQECYLFDAFLQRGTGKT